MERHSVGMPSSLSHECNESSANFERDADAKTEKKLDTSQFKGDNDIMSTSDMILKFPGGKGLLDNIEYGSLGVLNTHAAKLILNNHDISVKIRLKLWHALCPTDYLNLFGSAGARDSFCVIHAESLIVHICCMAEKEGYLLLDYASGPQTLQFIYRIERLLKNFVECGGSYQLVFFDVFKDVFDPSKKSGKSYQEGSDVDTFFDGYLLLRQILLAHAKLNKLPFLQFRDWITDKRWDKYLKSNEPTYIILEDGSSFLYVYNQIYELLDFPGEKGTIVERNAQIYAEYEEIRSRIDTFANATRSLAFQSLFFNVSVAYLFDIGRYSQDFKAFISFPSNCNLLPDLLDEISRNMVEEYALNDAEGEKDEGNVLLALLEETKLFCEKTLGIRDIVACNYFKTLMSIYSECKDRGISQEVFLYVDSCKLTFKTLLLHNFLMNNISLKERSTKRIDCSNWGFHRVNIAAALDFLYVSTLQVIKGIEKIDVLELDSIESYKKDISDLFDGNLFISILYWLVVYAKENDNIVDEGFLSLPDHVIETFNRLYRHFSCEDGSSFFPIDLSGFVDAGLYDIFGDNDTTEYNGKEDDKQTDLRKFDNSFINIYFGLKGFGGNTLKYSILSDGNMWNTFEELGWRDPSTVSERLECIDFFLNLENKEKQADLPRRSAKHEQRSIQRQTMFSHILSKYLGSSNLHHPIIPKLEHQWLDLKLKTLQKLAEASASTQDGGHIRTTETAKATKSKDKSAKVKEKQLKVSTKTEQLRQKHNEMQESKKRDNDVKSLARFELRFASLFSCENTFETITTNILDYTVGPNRAVNLICDFKWLKSIISTKQVQLQFILKMIECLFKNFHGYRLRVLKTKTDRSGLRKTVCLTIRLVHDCFNEYKSIIDGNGIILLQHLLIGLGMCRSSQNLFKKWLVEKENSRLNDAKDTVKSKNKVPPKLIDFKNCSVTDAEKFDCAIPDGLEVEFQLAYMGDLMERTLGSTVDSRVLFKPDAWQRMLLDAVDARESALVVAPTSTGKTYVCYYAMEQGLRFDDEGVVIYVSPNNALALQVTYEITARFSSKSYGSSPNCAAVLSASFLEKFHDPKWNCAQILVTVPPVLEQLLIAMRSTERAYTKRLEYLILDEIHCIADFEIGPFLERVIHLSACPFLALSATVGNPLQFHKWLSRVEKTRRGDDKINVSYIYFDERFSDLKLELYEDKTLVSLNPASCLTYHTMKTRGFPSDLYFPPRDCYIFVTALMSVMSHKCEDISYLNPSTYFSGTAMATKRQYRYYLETVKHEISKKVKDGIISEDDFTLLMSRIRSFNANEDFVEEEIYKLYPLLKLPSVDSKTLSVPSIFGDLYGMGHDYLLASEFINMLNTLGKAKRLPCLVFILDRNHMEHVLMSVTELLKRRQWEKYYGTPEAAAATRLENKMRNDRYQMLLKQYETERKMRSASKEQKEEQGITGSGEECMEMPTGPVDVAEDYDPEFNYYNRKIYVNYTDEVEGFISTAANSISNRRGVDLFVEALRRGIGIHHEGLPHKFTMLTETLFRLGFLEVILSSKSLAFGVNVPCKSVVFAGDNYELTPLMYKQMSGRCGRRSFDLSGYVIFWCIPKKRIKQLLTAQLPNLCGCSSSSPTDVLLSLSAFNSLLVVANSKNSTPLNLSQISATDARLRKCEIIAKSREAIIDPRVIVKRMSSIFLRPLESQFSECMEGIQEKIKFRIGAEILLELGLIDSHGFVRGCCELAILTRDAHPSNIFFAYIVQSGRMHEILENSKDAQFSLLHCLSQILYRKPQMGSTLELRRLLAPNIRVGKSIGSCLKSNIKIDVDSSGNVELSYPESFPFLPQPDDIMAEFLKHYNVTILNIISKYQALLGEFDLKLPLSNLDFVVDKGDFSGWFYTNYKKRHLKSTFRHPFVAIGGKGDDPFTGAREVWLTSGAKTGITLDMIPSIETNKISIVQFDSSFNVVKKLKITLDNSYICDYWTHGKFICVRDANGLGQYAWYRLKRIITFLKLSKLAIDTYTDQKPDADIFRDTIQQALSKLETTFSCI